MLLRALLALTLLATTSAAVHGEATTPFTVADSISMTRLTDPDPGQLSFFAPSFKMSPDATKFVVVTMRGNLSTGANEYSLLLYSVADVLESIRAPTAPLPQPRVLATMTASAYQYSIDHAIDAVRWLADNRTIVFIGRDSADVRQAFALDTQTQSLRQLTSHAHNVEMFDVSHDGGVVVYAARHPPDWSDRNTYGYVVRSNWMQDLARGDPRDATVVIRYFALNMRTGREVPVAVPSGILSRVVSTSPDGSKAVIFAQVAGIPDQWRAYDSLGLPTTAGQVDQDAFGSTSPWLGQFMLVDTATGEAHPLVDAPAKLDAVVRAIWSPDARRVVLCRTYLPLGAQAPGELERRRTRQSIVDVDLATGRAERIVDAADSLPDGRRIRIRAIDQPTDDTIVITQSIGGSTQQITQQFRFRSGRWVEAHRPVRNKSQLALAIQQGLNSPPEISATDLSGRARVFTDLNAQLRSKSMGRAEEYTWQDRLGHSHTGALVYPPDFQRGHRYPLVLQSSALPFRSDLFLVDGFGGATGPFAARALANKGMLALQMPVASQLGQQPAVSGGSYDWEAEGEAPRFVAMMEGAIDSLAANELIDTNKVGIIGFSRTGVHVSYALTFSRYPIAAATLADALAATPFAQSMMYGIPPPAGMLEFEQPAFMGAPFWGNGIKQWVDRSPLFHLDRLSAPLRLESYGLGIPAYWDTFALLKRQQRPVEMIHIPRGHHVLLTPFSRRTSQEGNVDWFAFWLKGEEDPAPDKTEQYARWHQLRLLNERRRQVEVHAE